ncbi:hypothetical protein FZ103_10540 [Streptomonospora sp. PA3]|uniref:hypothetical protein n=1 Tax=Streptomonospora sp. PA3 TaxID=2607326 RepID=UPI0012DCB54D|nr:hypothetical protein [Streptomonospora sp. PA3]MUL41608.1 hypothetical protein [Streptomonospora sp. PA3]
MDIPIEPAHLTQLRDGGPGSLLVWHEEAHRLRVTALTGGDDDPDVLGYADIIIAGYRDLPDADDTEAAIQRWAVRARQHALQRGLTPTVAPLRVAMRRRGLHLRCAPDIIGATGEDLPEIAEEYETDSGHAVVAVTTPLGYAAPARILVFDDAACEPLHTLAIEVEHASLLQAADIVAAAAHAAAYLM